MKTRSGTERESWLHPISVSVHSVEIAAAVERLSPSACLIRDTHLNREVCARGPGKLLGPGQHETVLKISLRVLPVR